MPRISRTLIRLTKYVPANKQAEIKPLVSKIDTLIKKGQNCGKAKQPPRPRPAQPRVTDYNILKARDIFYSAVREVMDRSNGSTSVGEAIRQVLVNGVRWGIPRVTLDTVVEHGEAWGIHKDDIEIYKEHRS